MEPFFPPSTYCWGISNSNDMHFPWYDLPNTKFTWKHWNVKIWIIQMMMIHMVVVMIFITSKHVPKTMVLKDKRLWKTKLQKIGMRRKNYRNPLNLSFGWKSFKVYHTWWKKRNPYYNLKLLEGLYFILL